MDLVNELAKVATRDERVNVDERTTAPAKPMITAAEQLLRDVMKGKRKRKEGLKGKVVAVYFSAVEIQRLERHIDRAGFTASGLVHEAAMKFLERLDELDGVLVEGEQVKGAEISAELTAQSARRLDKLAEMLTEEEKIAKMDLAFPESAEARRILREKLKAQPVTSSVASQNAGEDEVA